MSTVSGRWYTRVCGWVYTLSPIPRSAFSMNIPNLPMQLLAITDNGGASAFFNNDLCQMLITEGNAVADKLRAHFMTSPIGNQLKCTRTAPTRFTRFQPC